jgi:hypothetical protein
MAWLAALTVFATAGLAAPPVFADAQQTTIAIDGGHPSSRLPADFVGLSYEMRDLSLRVASGSATIITLGEAER